MNTLDRSLVLIVLLLASYSLAVKPSCKVCKDFVQAFNKRMDDTAKSNFAGGDTNWEEEKLGSYANSEVRLIEMLDDVCKHSDYDCHRLLENYEEDIERWWFKLRHKEEGYDDLKQWLCSTNLDVCCPPNTFGPTCSDCPGGREQPCGGHGSCQGSEEKDGKGKCLCNGGYVGDTCESCDPSYYNDTESKVCKLCDKACLKECGGPGADSCKECALGYEEVEGSCTDIDECKEDDSICSDGTYCLNTPGKHRCQACDKSCSVCNGPGPSKCGDCFTGYSRNEKGVCEDVDECEVESLCSSGTYCENTAGSHDCKACHISCQLSCSGVGPEGCDECKTGYRMEENICEDIDECTNTPGPCDPDNEVCVNLAGTFSCKCAEELVRSPDGDCVQPPKKPKKKKKKNKKGKKSKVSVTGGEGDSKDGATDERTMDSPDRQAELSPIEQPVQPTEQLVKPDKEKPDEQFSSEPAQLTEQPGTDDDQPNPSPTQVEPVDDTSSTDKPTSQHHRDVSPSDTKVATGNDGAAPNVPNQTTGNEQDSQRLHGNEDTPVSSERDEL